MGLGPTKFDIAMTKLRIDTEGKTRIAVLREVGDVFNSPCPHHANYNNDEFTWTKRHCGVCVDSIVDDLLQGKMPE